MAKTWKIGQLGTRLLAGGAGYLIGGPAGAAIGTSTVGPLVADKIFPQPDQYKDIFSWTEPNAFQAYESKPDSRLGVTTIKEEVDPTFMGTLKTVDAIGSAIGSFLPGGGLISKVGGNIAKTGVDAAKGIGSVAGKGTSSLANTGFNSLKMTNSGMRGGLYNNIALQGLLTSMI